MKKMLLLSFIILFSCSGNKNTTATSNNDIAVAKKIMTMNFDTYSDYWKQITQLENDGRTKSAYNLTKKIYTKAKAEKNSPQLIKVMMYQSKYILIIEEEAKLKIIQRFKKTIAESKAPEKNILESILAQMYWKYYQQNRYARC